MPRTSIPCERCGRSKWIGLRAGSQNANHRRPHRTAFSKALSNSAVSGLSGQIRSFRPLPNSRTWKGDYKRIAREERFKASVMRAPVLLKHRQQHVITLALKGRAVRLCKDGRHFIRIQIADCRLQVAVPVLLEYAGSQRIELMPEVHDQQRS